MNDDRLIEVFAGEFWQASVVKQILDDNGIPAELNNQYLSTVAPYLSAPGGVPSVTVIVSSTQLSEARRLVDEYLQGNTGDEMAD